MKKQCSLSLVVFLTIHDVRLILMKITDATMFFKFVVDNLIFAYGNP